MAFILKATQNVELAVTVADKKGNVAAVQNGVWVSEGPGVVSVTDNGNNSATASAVGTPGVATVMYTADVDLGDGVQNVVGTIDIEVVAGNASVFSIVPSAPTEQTDSVSSPTPPTPVEPLPVPPAPTPVEPLPAPPAPTTDPSVPTPASTEPAPAPSPPVEASPTTPPA